jgi:hypothetical protein
MMREAVPDEPRYCPNYDCSYRRRYRRAAEYSLAAERCSDCGTPLAPGSAPTVKAAGDAELGAPLSEPMVLHHPPLGLLFPCFCFVAGTFDLLWTGPGSLSWHFGASLLVIGTMMLRQRRRTTPRILPHERGFVVVVGHEHAPIPAARIETAQLTSRELRVAGLKLGTVHQLTLVIGGSPRVLTAFTRGGDGRFAEFARALVARSSLR